MTQLAAPARLTWLVSPAPAVLRLVERLALRWNDESAPSVLPETLVLGPHGLGDPNALQRWHETREPEARLLALGWLGTHPDARARVLLDQWEAEERARASGRAVLTLRVAPLLGAGTPLWAKLASRPALPRAGRDVIQPVLEDQVVETLERALTGRARWSGWYEVVGPEPLSLAELAELAARHAGPSSGGDWEPPLEVMREQRLGEPDAWLDHFGLEPVQVVEALTRGTR